MWVRLLCWWVYCCLMRLPELKHGEFAFSPFSAFHASQIKHCDSVLGCSACFVSFQVRQIQQRCHPGTLLPTTVTDTQVNTLTSISFVSPLFSITDSLHFWYCLPGITSRSRQRAIMLSAHSAASWPPPLTSWPWHPPAKPCRLPGAPHGTLGQKIWTESRPMPPSKHLSVWHCCRQWGRTSVAPLIVLMFWCETFPVFFFEWFLELFFFRLRNKAGETSQ